LPGSHCYEACIIGACDRSDTPAIKSKAGNVIGPTGAGLSGDHVVSAHNDSAETQREHEAESPSHLLAIQPRRLFQHSATSDLHTLYTQTMAPVEVAAPGSFARDIVAFNDAELDRYLEKNGR